MDLERKISDLERKYKSSSPKGYTSKQQMSVIKLEKKVSSLQDENACMKERFQSLIRTKEEVHIEY